eukprot:TRINITY_DN32583_c0_g1_i1.p2 TRINITY_DN32583_c0_g1~~TRINITY_DN32583_c0_g1_i1.p2  ORF type:complete len:208 (-),score=54.06 TRINITY_DN32583_c0_g1_i1:304-927(-)
MVFAAPELPLSQLPESERAALLHLRLGLLGLWLCALGRFVEGNDLGAFNDVFASLFGLFIFRDDLCCCCPSLKAAGAWLSSAAAWIPGGTACLGPFALLAGLNAVFDVLYMALACDFCATSAVWAATEACSGCFFTFGAAVLQLTGAILAWRVHQVVSAPSFHYVAVPTTAVTPVVCADASSGDAAASSCAASTPAEGDAVASGSAS